MRYHVNITLEVDEEANFLGLVPEENLSEVLDVLRTAIYEVDDFKLINIEVEEL